MLLRVLGECMGPTLKLGDNVVTIASEKTYRIGDIVVLRSAEDDLLLHRIVAKLNGRFFIKGDLGGTYGHLTHAQDLLGKAIFRERKGQIKSLDTFFCRFMGLVINLSFILIGIIRLVPLKLRLKRKY